MNSFLSQLASCFYHDYDVSVKTLCDMDIEKRKEYLTEKAKIYHFAKMYDMYVKEPEKLPISFNVVGYDVDLKGIKPLVIRLDNNDTIEIEDIDKKLLKIDGFDIDLEKRIMYIYSIFNMDLSHVDTENITYLKYKICSRLIHMYKTEFNKPFAHQFFYYIYRLLSTDLTHDDLIYLHKILKLEVSPICIPPNQAIYLYKLFTGQNTACPQVAVKNITEFHQLVSEYMEFTHEPEKPMVYFKAWEKNKLLKEYVYLFKSVIYYHLKGIDTYMTQEAKDILPFEFTSDPSEKGKTCLPVWASFYSIYDK